MRKCPGTRRSFSTAFAPPHPALVTNKTNARIAAIPRKRPHRRYVSSNSSEKASATKTASAETSKATAEAAVQSEDSYFGVLFQRLAMSLGIVYIVTEYGIEWTVCEGPSMMPTVKPRGEIVLIDRLTPKLWGLAGGDTIQKREASARALQQEHVNALKHAKRQEQEWLLRLYQTEEEKVKTNDNGKTAQILREIREDLEKMSSNEDFEETWHETRIPIDELPPEKAWDRFRTQITTGISVGDVVVLQHPDRVGTVCKRVMGLPGDIVTKPSSRLGANRVEALLYGTSKETYESKGERLRTNQRTKRRLLSSGVKIPDGHIWVEGDNPWNSSDSRNYGAVPASLIMGRVLLRLWPLRGNALMERGSRPVRSDSDEASLAFSGSIVVPVGWDDQRILRESVPQSTKRPSPAKQPN